MSAECVFFSMAAENRCWVASGQLLKTAKNLWKSMPTELKLYVYKYTVHVCKNVKEMLSKKK